jgi:hypothetical protein
MLFNQFGLAAASSNSSDDAIMTIIAMLFSCHGFSALGCVLFVP